MSNPKPQSLLTDSDDKLYSRIAWGMVVLGVALRVWQYLWNTGFWYDEAWVLMNIQDLSFVELAGALKHDQSAPLGYLWLLRALYVLGGLNEFLLRAPSLIAVVLGMVLMLPLARRIVKPKAVPWVLVMLAASEYLIVFGSRTKPYTIDALGTILLLYTAIRLKDSSPLKFIVVIGAIGLGLFWFSYPSCFVYGGAAVMCGLKLLRSRRWQDWAGYILINIIVAAGMYMMMHFTSQQRTNSLQAYWAVRGFPMGWGIKQIIHWPLDATFRYFEVAIRPIGLFACLTSVLAIVAMWRNKSKRFALGLLAMPLILNFVAGCLELYPFVGKRVTLYAVPLILLLSGEGWATILEWIKRPRVRKLAFLVGALIIAVPVVVQVHYLTFTGHRGPHASRMAEYVLKNCREGDCVFIAGSGEFGIYTRGKCEVPVFGGLLHINAQQSDLDTVTWQRCWLYVRTDNKVFRATRDNLLKRHGVIESLSDHKTELYLLKPTK